ncbi:hypothetical protein [Pseudotabrizicola sp.]|uniref:hypothetical protein n=1 Tax=Pseudotabrizicola sp. TaxID=2939647 RepID=UPI002717811D|nr:hypothetical protein [Pseudotabrizicola sp.]MDO8884688.1 hypothetical protein [Pseudotabrizicola sp.]
MMLIAQMPEIGTIAGEKAAALTGLAPVAAYHSSSWKRLGLDGSEEFAISGMQCGRAKHFFPGQTTELCRGISRHLRHSHRK